MRVRIGEAIFPENKLVKRAKAASSGHVAECRANIVSRPMRHLGVQTCYSGNRGSVEGTKIAILVLDEDHGNLNFSRCYKGVMDMSWITDRIAVGGGIWVESKMA